MFELISRASIDLLEISDKLSDFAHESIGLKAVLRAIDECGDYDISSLNRDEQARFLKWISAKVDVWQKPDGSMDLSLIDGDTDSVAAIFYPYEDDY